MARCTVIVCIAAMLLFNNQGVNMSERPIQADVVIINGRVIDPETHSDVVATVAIRDGVIVAIGDQVVEAPRTIDAKGLIVAPGFIDLHAHGQSLPADRMQAFDGVTTALELEIGNLNINTWYEQQAGTRVLNYGTSAAWIFARKATLVDMDVDPKLTPLESLGAKADDMRWSTDVATDAQVTQIVAMTRQAIDEGAVGIGIPNGYAPAAGVKEITHICQLAAALTCPTFSHVPFASNIDPKSAIESYIRIIGYAAATGAHMHICHLNSTSLQDIAFSVEILKKAQQAGLPITVEAYPYGTGSTVVGAGFFMDPQFPERTGTPYSAIELLKNRHRFADVEEVIAAREDDPSALVLWHFLDTVGNTRDHALLDLSVMYAGGAIASDAMPWSQADGRLYTGDAWPIPDEMTNHPRSSGTFTRFIHQWVVQRKVVPLMEAIEKSSLIPARILEKSVPAMQKKGRLQVGCDADIIVFNLATLQDKATFDCMNAPSTGMQYVLVNGEMVIDDGQLVLDARPGKAVRRPVSTWSVS
jgi:N-acyl-D-aspartate/D-glutamate deacylase